MLTSIKALVAVLGVGALIFYFAKPFILKYTSEADYSRRRLVWMVVTVVAFLSPNFWILTAVMVPLYFWCGREDANPLAVYLLLMHVIPSAPLNIPLPGFSKLFGIDNYRLLSLCVLIPAALRYRGTLAKTPGAVRFGTLDVCLLVTGLLALVWYVPPETQGFVVADTWLNRLRRIVLGLLDGYIIFYVASRTLRTKEAMLDCFFALCLACTVMASVAVMETVRGWLLYTDLIFRWSGNPGMNFYIMRGNSLRAQASAGHALALGYMLALALGIWLFLSPQIRSKWARLAGFGAFGLGLVATFSRGPWAGAVLIVVAFVALGPNAMSKMVKYSLTASVLALVLLLSPLGENIQSALPFGKGTDTGSIDYRKHLADRSWEIFKQKPIFGDQLAYLKMEELRQGQGIIDTVNTYAWHLTFHGIVGLTFFAGYLLVALAIVYRTSKRFAAIDKEFSLMGTAIGACLVGTIFMLANCSFILAYDKMYYVLGGLALAYATIGRAEAAKLLPAASVRTRRPGLRGTRSTT